MKRFCVTEHFSVVNSQVSFHLGAHIGLDAKSIFLTKSDRGRQEEILLSLSHVKKSIRKARSCREEGGGQLAQILGR